MSCPCGSPDYAQCCGRFHAGALAQTAEQLMRSRYAAFALGRWDYVAQTQTAAFGGAPQHAWFSLTVHDAKETEVEFTARYVERDREVSLRERSRFQRVEGRWLYADGVPQVTTRKLSRNEPCPCGSGKKLKACHGALG